MWRYQQEPSCSIYKFLHNEKGDLGPPLPNHPHNFYKYISIHTHKLSFSIQYGTKSESRHFTHKSHSNYCRFKSYELNPIQSNLTPISLSKQRTCFDRGPLEESSSRTRSPVAMCGTPRRAVSRLAYVPFPTPGHPRNTHWTFLPLGSMRGVGQDWGLISVAAAVDRDLRMT